MTTRRHLLVTFGAAMIAHPLALLAQQPPKIRRVGYLGTAARPEPFDTSGSGAFARGMRELGYIDSSLRRGALG